MRGSILRYLELAFPLRFFSATKFYWLIVCSSLPVIMGYTSLVSIAAPQQIAQVISANANRPTLKVGSEGSAVSELQAALKLLGFYTGEVDGKYNDNTASAVSRFKQAAGLKADGIVDISTWQRLFPNEPVVTSNIPPKVSSFPVPTQTAPNTVVNPTPTPTPTTTTVVNPTPKPKPTTPNNTTVVTTPEPRPAKPNNTKVVTTPEPRPAKPNSTKVVNQTPEPRPAKPSNTNQRTTRQSSTTRSGSTTSTQTRTSTKPNTRTQTSTRSGVTNTRTQTSTRREQIPGIQYTSEGLPILRLGMRGTEVGRLQTRLQRLGLFKGDIDGDFGAETETAVKAAQERFGIEADGVVGGATWEVLNRPRGKR
jgi:peptidoglycan hydrolase-like protein with peptidoglycan-binding domain